jgi:hypothetical protein
MANDLVMANDLDDLDEAEGDPQPAEGRDLVIADLGHRTTMHPWSCTGPSSWQAATRPDIYL